MTALISARDLRKIYETKAGAVPALDGVDLDVGTSDLSVAIQGPSGSGKSTLLACIGLLEKPSSGCLELMGADASSLSAEQCRLLRNNQIGWIFQNFALISKLTVSENILLPLEFGDKEARRRGWARLSDLLDRLDLASKASSFPPQLSGGQQQRVAIARALVTAPRLILADEPTGNLDRETGATIVDCMMDVVDDGATLIIVTHDDDVASRCNRVISIVDGRVSAA